MNPSLPRACPPILLIVFKRPSLTREVMKAIRQARPSRFYVAGDGPRKGRPGEAAECEAARTAAMEVDWPCQLRTRFQDANLGCKVGVRTAIDWFFDCEEEGIILEDDVVPVPTFFPFCAELLERYRGDTRISMIGGTNLVTELKHCRESYYFSRLHHVWGWATWRRSWRCYDREMALWADFKAREQLSALGFGRTTRRDLAAAFEEVASGKRDTWDYQWLLTGLAQNTLSVVPRQNLVSNIGFGDGATHTTNRHAKYSVLPAHDMEFPLVHPGIVAPNFIAERGTLRQQSRSLPRRVVGALLRRFGLLS